ncbi:MAG TPA: hypothetical protein VMR21_16170 [Vicinamibacteria bacterium]|nr:hypothetical protein [Vicinamibacteria bacterium]
MRAATFAPHVVALAMSLAGSEAAPVERPRLQLVWVDPSGLAPAAYAKIVTESGKALRDLGAELQWTVGTRGAVLEPEALAVIAVRTHAAGPSAGRHVLGATPPGPQRPPAVWVYPDQVAWALGLDFGARASWNKIAHGDFALALARVVSHEVAHALGARAHTRSGLMAATLDRHALRAASLRLDAVTAATLRGSLAGGAMLAQGPRVGGPSSARPRALAPPSPPRAACTTAGVYPLSHISPPPQRASMVWDGRARYLGSRRTGPGGARRAGARTKERGQ